MPRPTAEETEAEFVSRFMASPEARRDYPDEKQRAAVAYSMFKERKNQSGQTAKSYDCNFIEPGLVSYRDIGIVLVKKEALDRMASTFRGKPVFNEIHKEVTARDFSDGLTDGVVTGVAYQPADGWYHAEFFVLNEDTVRNCESGYSVSCAYDVTKWGPGGVHHNIPYQAEVLDGVYTHLAIVPNPRYEAARIIYNTGGAMKLKFWKKNDEVKNASEVELENATVAVGEQEVPISKMVTLWNAAEEEKKRKEEAAKGKALLNDDDTVDIGGKRVSVKELKEVWNAKNADPDKDDKDKKDKKDNADDDETEEEKKKRLERLKERGNADPDKDDDDEDKGKRKDNASDDDDDETEEERKKRKDRENAGAEGFRQLKNAAATRPGEFKAPQIMTPDQKVAEGYKRYGPRN